MKPLKNKVVLVFLGLLILIVLIPLIMFLILARQNDKRQPPMPTSHPGTNQTLEGAAFWLVISHNVSMCSSSESSSANATSGQCHLNKKNVAEALLFEGKALLPGSLAMERGISALDNARVKAEAAWGQQGSRFAQIGQESLLQPRDLPARDQGKLIAGDV